MIGSSMRLWQILFFSLCVTTALSVRKMSRISIENEDFKRGAGDIMLGSICEIGDYVTYDCYHKECPTLESKNKDFTINFKTPFSEPPKVLVSITELDSNKNSNVRIRTTANDITEEGFRLNIKVWLDTHVYTAEVQWIACGPTRPRQLSVEVGGAVPKA